MHDWLEIYGALEICLNWNENVGMGDIMKIDILGEDKSALKKPFLRFQLKKFE